MKLLATIHPEDVDPHSPHFDYTTFLPRPAGRVVLIDGDKVALLHVTKHDYYMLPGGGLDDDDIASALAREIQEELGCHALIDQEVGLTEVYIDRWHQKQIDSCFIAHITGQFSEKEQTDFEKEEGHEVVWAPSIQEAIRLVETAIPENRDGKLVRARDLIFLKAAVALLA